MTTDRAAKRKKPASGTNALGHPHGLDLLQHRLDKAMRKASATKNRDAAGGIEGVESATQARVLAEEGRAEAAEAASESGDWRG